MPVKSGLSSNDEEEREEEKDMVEEEEEEEEGGRMLQCKIIKAYLFVSICFEIFLKISTSSGK